MERHIPEHTSLLSDLLEVSNISDITLEQNAV